MSTDRSPQQTASDPVTEDPAVAAFLERLHAAYGAPPDPALAHRHMERMLTEVASQAPATAPWWRRSGPAVARIGRRAAALGAVKLALTAGLAAAATGTGLAATGNLPPAVQHDVAGVLGRVGITVPDPAAEAIADTPAGGQAPPGLGGDGDGDATTPPGLIDRPGDAPPTDPAGRDGRAPAAPSEGESANRPDEGGRRPSHVGPPVEPGGQPDTPRGDAGQQGRDQPDDAGDRGRGGPADENRGAPARTGDREQSSEQGRRRAPRDRGDDRRTEDGAGEQHGDAAESPPGSGGSGSGGAESATGADVTSPVDVPAAGPTGR